VSGQDVREFVRSYLLARGCSDSVVRGGIPYLVARWADVAASVERGYTGDLDDYLNDMDVRQILADVRAYHVTRGLGSPNESEADRRLRRQWVPARGCLWGDAAAERNGWTPARNWWYFGHPRHPGDALLEDLRRRNLLIRDGRDAGAGAGTDDLAR
jgi:hypothetical protein